MKALEIWLIQHIGRVGAFIISITLRGILWTVAIVGGIYIVWFTGALSNPKLLGDSLVAHVFIEFLAGVCLWLLVIMVGGTVYYRLIEPSWNTWKQKYPEQKDKP